MGKRILIIENHSSTQDAMREILESDCTEIIYAKSVREALNAFLNQEFTLVIFAKHMEKAGSGKFRSCAV